MLNFRFRLWRQWFDPLFHRITLVWATDSGHWPVLSILTYYGGFGTRLETVTSRIFPFLFFIFCLLNIIKRQYYFYYDKFQFQLGDKWSCICCYRKMIQVKLRWWTGVWYYHKLMHVKLWWWRLLIPKDDVCEVVVMVIYYLFLPQADASVVVTW